MQNPILLPKDVEAEIESESSELIEAAATVFAVQRVHGEEIKEQAKQSYGRLVDAHLLIVGVLGAALLRVNGKFHFMTPTSEQRDALFATFVIGMELCEKAISEGQYLQACTLLRQEMETIAQLKAVSSGKRNEARSPNISALEPSLKRLYDELSGAAHVAKHDVVRTATEYEMSGKDLPGPTSGTRYFPAFDETLARRLFGLHLMLIARLIEELSVDHREHHTDDCFSAKDNRRLELAMLLMEAEGMVIID